MAAISGSVSISISISAPVVRRGVKATNGASSFNSVSFFSQRRNFHTLSLSVSCDAKKETVDKVCEIVRKQLAIPAETDICGESKFSDLGADSLDTVEIVMGLEECFDISVDEGSAQDIATVGDAAEMIEKLIESK